MVQDKGFTDRFRVGFGGLEIDLRLGFGVETQV